MTRAARLALATLLLGAGCGRTPEPESVVLITLDTTRADRLGCYGYDAAHTPALDALADRGVVFDNARCTVPVTLPSHASILTGLSPITHGLRDNGLFRMAEELETATEVFQRAGYQTGAFVSAFVLSREYGTAQGFDVFDDYFYNERPGFLTTRKASSWIDGLDTDRPFFLWVHYFDPHLPRHPIEPFKSMPALDPYDQEVAAMDAAIGGLLSALDAKGVGDAHIVVVGDHGEGLGDHGEEEHGLFLYDSTIRVPLIVAPRTAQTGRREVAPVSTVDIAQTLLELGGQSGLPAAEGRSLVSYLTRDAEPAPHGYAETYFPEFNFYHSHLFAIWNEAWKYIDAPEPELYDLRSDAGELRNVIGRNGDVARSLKGRLDAMRADADSGAATSGTVTAEQIERLQSLGYLAGGDVALTMQSSGDFLLPDPKRLGPIASTFTRATAEMNAGEYETAAALLEEVLAVNPENVIARINLGKVYAALRNFDDAIHHLEEARVLAPTNATCTKYLGLAYQSAGRYDESIELLRTIRDDPVQGITAGREMARTYLKAGAYDDALRTFRELADQTGGDQTHRALAAKVAQLIAARGLLEEDPGREDARLTQAAAALDLRLLDLAKRSLDFRGDTEANEARRRQLRGSVAGAEGDFETARREFEAALAYFRHEPYLRTQLSGLYLHFGDADRALQLCESLIQEGSPSAVVYYNKACAHSLKGEIDESIKALRQSIGRGFDDYQFLQEDPDLAATRQDPRFIDVMTLIGTGAEPI